MGSLGSKQSAERVDVRSLSGSDPSGLHGLRARAMELESTLTPSSLKQRLLQVRREVHGRIVFTTSFGLEDQLILHVLRQLHLDIEIATLDTGRLFAETYDLWAESERRYGVRIRPVYPQHAAVEALVVMRGINGFYESPEGRMACCRARKVEPLNRALAGAAAWITGIRAGQSNSRRELGLVDVDEERGILKFNPLFDWTREAVLNATRAGNVPVNSLHAKGFASIGCAPCTRAIGADEPERAGRWWWEQDGKKECGLHERSSGRAAPDPAETKS